MDDIHWQTSFKEKNLDKGGLTRISTDLRLCLSSGPSVSIATSLEVVYISMFFFDCRIGDPKNPMVLGVIEE